MVTLEKEKKLRRDQLKTAQESYRATVKRFDLSVKTITDLTDKIEGYQDASCKMQNSLECRQKLKASLQSDFNRLENKNKSAAHVMSLLQSNVDGYKQRTQRSVQTHTAHITARKKQMEESKDALKTALELNKRLANDYRRLRKTLPEAKKEAFLMQSKKRQAEETFNYYTQSALLQKRMHKDLEYLGQRALNSQAKLDRWEQETNEKIKAAEENLSKDIELIASFRESLTDDWTKTDTTDNASGQEQASSDAAGLNE
ncbi:myosin heavy chain, non-muscle-like [Cololabis saira]|uniref:myosin heavy chain, non-muscle-like n=1 Tax=Cololabis saira TaxID=129043 RepID=UPI002AD2A887|nr:myosin heavy chain, non-muscle-like [Cololabis saira]